jgi:glycosyltransferase involved in cell wall biosynthesis
MSQIASITFPRESESIFRFQKGTMAIAASGVSLHEEYSEGSKRLADEHNGRLAQSSLEVGLLTGVQDGHYPASLAIALAAKGVSLDVIGSDRVDGPKMHCTAGLRFFRLYDGLQGGSAASKMKRVLVTYIGLIRYAWAAKPKILHIMWNYKFEIFDRTLLMLYYKFLGKKVVLTVHNVNAGRRDSKDSLLNRLTLMFQYRVADHLFVHTRKMKSELLKQFHVKESAVTVIPHGVNDAAPNTGLTSLEAKQRMGIRDGEKTLLFFGAIRPYKGLEYLVAAFQQIAAKLGGLRLIIAGAPKKGCEAYLTAIQQTIDGDASRAQVVRRIEFIPDSEMELYFKAADVAVLPYTEIFQSGVLFLAFSFGLPAIATDVGSFAEDILEGETGFICKPCDPEDLAVAIQRYFESDLYRELEHRRSKIRDNALSKNSWDLVGNLTRDVYSALLL